MNRHKFILKAFLLSIAFVLLSVISIVVVFEGQTSRNMVINISKRVVAEAGAVVSGDMEVLNNIAGWKEGNEISFGPEKTTQAGTAEKIDDYIKKNLKGAKITDIHNYDISKYAMAFQYEDIMAPQLKLLRKEYNLDELAADGDSEMDRFIALRNWVKNAIPRGRPKGVDYNFNAIDILTRAGKGETFFCSEYSTVFVQCALSLGFQARYVGLFKGHAVAEIWSNRFAKWIVMDIDNNLHYERQGIPLNALELHLVLEENKLEDIKAIRGLVRDETSHEERNSLVSYYHGFFVRMRNDWFSNRYPHWHRKGNSIMNSLEWEDEHTKDNMLVSHKTRNRDEIYFPINITSIRLRGDGPTYNNLRLIFDTFTPGFSHFLIKIDEDVPVKSKIALYEWNLHPGMNMIRVMAFNILDVAGPESEIRIFLN